MLSRVKELPTSHGFPAGSKLFVYNEVIDRDDGAVRVDQYYNTGNICCILYIFRHNLLLSFFHTGLVTEFRYCMKLAWGIADYGQLGGLVDYGWGMAQSDRAFVFVDNHDNQRGHGGAGKSISSRL